MKKTITTLLLLLLIIPTLSKLNAQNIYWENHNTYSSVKCMLDIDTSIVVGTNGGVATINKTTQVVKYLDRINSPLSGEKVTCLEQGNNGYVWMGTECGLGEHLNGIWINYNSQNTILPSDCFSALYYDQPTETMWVGLCDGNVATYHNSAWNLIVDNDGNKPLSGITSIVMDSSDFIWVGTINNGVYKWDGFNWINFDSTAFPLENNVNSMAVDNTGKLWVSNPDKLVSFDGTFWETFIPAVCANLKHISINSSTNSVIVSSDCGVYNFDGTNWDILTATDTLTDTIIMYHIYDNNNLWTGTKSHGVDKILTATTISNIPLHPDLRHKSVSAIDIAATSVLWVGYNNIQETSLSSLTGPAWAHFNPSVTTALNNSIGEITCLQMQTTKLWISTYGSGIYTKSGNTWASFKKSNSNIENDSVTTLGINSINSILVGFYNGAVAVKGQFPGFTPIIAASQIKSRINRIFAGINSKTWIATDTTGLVLYQGSGLTFYNKYNSPLTTNKIIDVKEDANHILWLATDSGLVTFDGIGIWNHYNISNSPLPTNQISTISLGKDSSMWIGTKDLGIVRFKNNTWTVFDQCNSKLVSNNIQIIESANNGKTFVGTDNGLSIISFDVFTGQTIISDPSTTHVYPNPSSDKIRFEIALPGANDGTFRLYNSFGQLVLSLNANFDAQGTFNYTWDIVNSPVDVKPGLYFYSLESGSALKSGKVLVVK